MEKKREGTPDIASNDEVNRPAADGIGLRSQFGFGIQNRNVLREGITLLLRLLEDAKNGLAVLLYGSGVDCHGSLVLPCSIVRQCTCYLRSREIVPVQSRLDRVNRF